MPHSLYGSVLSWLPGTAAYDDLPPHLRPFADAARAARSACLRITDAMIAAGEGQDRAAAAILAEMQRRALRAWRFTETRGAILFTLRAPAALAAGRAAQHAAFPPDRRVRALRTAAERLAAYLPPVSDATDAARGACEALAAGVEAAQRAGDPIAAGLLAQLHDTICALADATEGGAGELRAEITAGPTVH